MGNIAPEKISNYERILQSEEQEEIEEQKATSNKNVLYGALWLSGGIIFTVVSYSSAGSVGSYTIASGAILGGLFQLFRGLASVD